MTPHQSSLLMRLRSMDDQAEFAAADWIEELLDEVAALRAVVRECITAMPENGPVFMDDGSCEGNRYPVIPDPAQQAAALRALLGAERCQPRDSGRAETPASSSKNGSHAAPAGADQ